VGASSARLDSFHPRDNQPAFCVLPEVSTPAIEARTAPCVNLENTRRGAAATVFSVHSGHLPAIVDAGIAADVKMENLQEMQPVR